MLFQDALKEQELQVSDLIKTAEKYLASLKSWKKACETGHLVNRQKAADSANSLVKELEIPTNEAAGSWNLNAQEYLESSAWIEELGAACSKINLRVVIEDDHIVSPPVIVRAQPHQARLLLGKKPWSAVHPAVIAKELKRLNEISINERECQQFLNSVYEACKRDSSDKNDLRTKFIDVFKRWEMTPGYKVENSRASFGQQINALDESGVRTTKDGKVFHLDGPDGKANKDIFDVVSKDGLSKQYFIIWFQ